ncbi:capsular biosynthesis protein [Methylosinus sp. LW3]|uniref:capsular biosynthesis protein n=1 Tax=Methylosinus sp. LW3 TaxID=107635 RepID=UPI0004662D46|nr:capsular biosynthesis protein [Methylosinus sp. LW3]
MKRLIVDLDNTLTIGETDDYRQATPNLEMIARLRDYRKMGFEIAIHTSRNMRSYENSMGKIAARTLPIVTDWLERHGVPYDEIWIGKPWCGREGFYIDDRAVRPSEFLRLSFEEITDLLADEVRFAQQR